MLEQRYVVDKAKEEQYRRLAELRTAMANLSACLRIAGALCAAHGIGRWSSMRDGITGEWFTWNPGCGHPVNGVR